MNLGVEKEREGGKNSGHDRQEERDKQREREVERPVVSVGDGGSPWRQGGGVEPLHQTVHGRNGVGLTRHVLLGPPTHLPTQIVAWETRKLSYIHIQVCVLRGWIHTRK